MNRRSPHGLKPALYACAGILFVVAAPAAQQTPPETPFRYERPVQTGGPGPRRLAIDIPLLVGGNPFRGRVMPGAGLTDLRFFDPNGQELQYLLVSNPPEPPAWRSAQTLAIAPVETPALKASGFEIDLGEAIVIDRFRVDGIAGPFLKRIRLEGSGDRARWTLLVDEGTLFDLPQERMVQTELGFAAGAYRYVRLTWDDTRSGRLPRPELASVREVRTATPPPALTTPLTFERRPSEPGRGQFRVRLPAARLPIVALDVDIGGARILRQVTVYEPHLIGGQVVPTQLGAGVLRRVVQDEMTASAIRIPIASPEEPLLDLVIDEGNNPPSEVRGITAVFAELPWIYFESTSNTVIARYGNPSLKAPRYDLEAVRQTAPIATTMEATWGEARLRGESEKVSSVAPALPTVGATVDPATFRYVRPIPSGEAGLVTIPLDAAVLAHGRPAAFADVRVIDAANRQVPYLIERASEPLSLDLAIEPVATRPASLASNRTLSVYRVRLPLEQLPQARVVLTTPARVFTRRVTVGVEHGPDRRRRDPWFETLATSDWSHADQESPAPALTMAVRPIDAREVFITVEEGDNSPLPFAPARLLLPSYRLRLFRERNAALRLAYGRDDLSPPQYDLALIAPQLTGVTAIEIMPGPEQTSAPESPLMLMSPQIFWAVLSAAVLILIGLVVRLVRKSDVQSTPAT
ncbi:MAG TPA: DUF3999 family protein [Vicinamibacterales bacterium]|nr:DUF3999 family protein [Vicinamibacterales bacterium]